MLVVVSRILLLFVLVVLFGDVGIDVAGCVIVDGGMCCDVGIYGADVMYVAYADVAGCVVVNVDVRDVDSVDVRCAVCGDGVAGVAGGDV